MTDNENISPNDRTSKESTSVNDASHEVKIVIGNEQDTHPAPIGPSVIRVSNVPDSIPVTIHRSLGITKQSDETSTPVSEDIKHGQDDAEQGNQRIRSDAELSEAASVYEDCEMEHDDEDGYDFDSEDDDDDDLSLENDPFFGDAAQIKPDQPTEEQLEAIRKTMEEDEKKAAEAEAEQKALEEANREAVQRALTDALPPAPVDNSTEQEVFEPAEPPHPLLSEQVNNATELVLILRSFLGGESLMLVVGYNEPLFEMKLKFIQAVNLDVTELESLVFLFGEYHILDEDTAYELGMCNGANVYCERIGAMPDDAVPDSATS